MRDAIWREYRNGQEISKRPTFRYLAVQQRAIGELLFKPHDEAAAARAAPYLVKSELYREKAMSEGHGDPLESLQQKEPEPKEPVTKQRSFDWSK